MRRQEPASPSRRALRLEALQPRRLLSVFSVGNTDGSGEGSPRWAVERTAADLAVTKTAGRVSIREGETVTYTITVTNKSLLAVEGASVADRFPQLLTDVTLTEIAATAGASSSLSTGPLPDGVFQGTADLPGGATVTYTVTARVAGPATANAAAQRIVTNPATVAVPKGFIELEPADNTAHDSDVVVLAPAGGSGIFIDGGQSLGYFSTLGVALGDLDGDGDLDAFAANFSKGNWVGINQGGAQGGTPGQLLDSGQRLGQSSSTGVALGDLDGDGDLDAFVANDTGQANRVWVNDGTGQFTEGLQALGDSWSEAVALGDLDGDGDLDALAANGTEPNRVWINQGNGLFTEGAPAPGEHGSAAVALGDLDGDGDLDAFLANNARANRIWINDGSGFFTDSAQSLGSAHSTDVSLGDLDGDGDLDAFVVNTSSQPNRVWWNDGAGQFIDSGQSLGNRSSLAIALGDLDADGDLDAFVANEMANRVWINDGSGMFVPSGQTLGDMWSQDVALGDLDGDGDLDAFESNNWLGNRVWLNQAPPVAKVQAVLRAGDTALPPGPQGEAEPLPESLAWIDEWDSFWLEIWGNTPQTADQGISRFSLDLVYPTEWLSAASFEYGPAFAEDQTGSIDDAAGQVNSLGAVTLRDDAGDDKSVLLARVRFEPAAGDQGLAHNADGQYLSPVTDLGFALAEVSVDLTAWPSVEVELGDPPPTEAWPVMYDVDDDGQVGFGDLAYFATAFQQTVGDAESPFAWACDFDRSGRVDVGDLAFFAQNFGYTAGSPIIYPGNFPDAWRDGTAALAGLPESTGTELPQTAGRAPLHDLALEACYDCSHADESGARRSHDLLGYASWLWDVDTAPASSRDSSDTKDAAQAADFLIANGYW